MKAVITSGERAGELMEVAVDGPTQRQVLVLERKGMIERRATVVLPGQTVAKIRHGYDGFSEDGVVVGEVNPDMSFFIPADNREIPSEFWTRLHDEPLEEVHEDFTEHRKDDDHKPRFDLIPPLGELEVAQVFTDGGNHYGDDNWKKCTEPKRYLNALMRHLNAYRLGEVLDADSGKMHLAHVVCNAHILMGLEEGTICRK